MIVPINEQQDLAIIPEVVAQHCEEACFLREIRTAQLHASHLSLQDLARIDERIEAHLDGLRIAGGPARRMFAEMFELKTEHEVFVHAVLESELEPDIAARLFPREPLAHQWWRGVRAAIAWIEDRKADRIQRALWQAAQPAVRLLALPRADPGFNAARDCFLPALADEREWVRAEACGIAGDLRIAGLLDAVLGCLASPEEATRYAATRAALLLGANPLKLPGLGSLNEWGPLIREEIAQLAPLIPNQAREWILRSREMSGCRRAGIIAAGSLGEPWCIPGLLEDMQLPECARIAAESITAIAGVRFSVPPFTATAPPDFTETPTDDPDDEDVSVDADDRLPWPDAVAAAEWWSEHGRAFSNASRYWLGAVESTQSLASALRTESQRMRAIAALRLSCNMPSLTIFDITAPAWKQARILTNYLSASAFS